jgi:phosphoenolpyruvate-protein phosphotransferase
MRYKYRLERTVSGLKISGLRSDKSKKEVLMKSIKAIAVSPGYANGTVTVYEPPLLNSVLRRFIPSEAVESECDRFTTAIDHAVGDVAAAREQVAADIGDSEAAIFDAHIAMMCDPLLVKNILNRITKKRVCAETALADEVAAFCGRLSAYNRDYTKELILDVHDIGNRLLHRLSLDEKKNPLADLSPDSIIVARSLMPSETIGMDRTKVSGIATELGGPTSHAAILARSLGIPAVTGLTGLMESVEDGCTVLLNGTDGSILIDPTDSQRKRFTARRRKFEQSQKLMSQLENKVCRLSSRTRIHLRANVNHSGDIELANKHNMEGIGLYRTELFYLQSSSPPSLSLQCKHYQQAAAAGGIRPVTIRTFDFSTDKRPSFLSVDVSATHDLHGLRFALRNPRLFKSQLRAIIRVAKNHPNLRILFPMVTGWWELQEAFKILQAIAAKENFNRQIPVGAMIETPAAVFELPKILEQVDFISIGCNDLAQHILAIERNACRNIGESTLHPSLLRAIRQVVGTAGKAGCPVSVCGEAASDPLLAVVFAGLGVREISVSPARAPAVRYALSHLSLDDAKKLAECAINSNPSTVIDDLMAILPASLRPVITLEHGDKPVSAPAASQQTGCRTVPDDHEPNIINRITEEIENSKRCAI